MATRVQSLSSGSGNGGALRGTATTWTLTLGSTPIVGNTLILYIGAVNALSITSIVQGGSGTSWTLATSSTNTNTNIYVYYLNVTSGSNTTITLTLGSANNKFYSICEEMSGIQTGSILDKSAANAQTSTNSPVTGTTGTTTSATEYWVNVHAYYSAASGDPVPSSPTNSYAFYSTTPTHWTDAGWTGGAAVLTPTDFAGMVMEYKSVLTTGTAGGGFSDSSLNADNYNSLALAFFATAGGVVARRRCSVTIN